MIPKMHPGCTDELTYLSAAGSHKHDGYDGAVLLYKQHQLLLFCIDRVFGRQLEARVVAVLQHAIFSLRSTAVDRQCYPFHRSDFILLLVAHRLRILGTFHMQQAICAPRHQQTAFTAAAHLLSAPSKAQPCVGLEAGMPLPCSLSFAASRLAGFTIQWCLAGRWQGCWCVFAACKCMPFWGPKVVARILHQLLTSMYSSSLHALMITC